MPYRRVYRRRKRFVRRRRPITYGQIGSKIWRDVRYLKSIINVERKYLDKTASTTYNSSGATTSLVTMALGDTASTRDGQSIKCVYSLLTGYATINASATQTVVRIMLIYDSQPNAAAAAFAAFLTATDVVSPILISNGARFRVLMDRRLSLSINGDEIKHFKRYMKLNFHVKYNTGNNGDITDVTTGNYFIAIVSNEATNAPTVTWNHRLRFIDN